ncbi:MAG: GNAT family N-acetyltransferase [Chloroflexota bacterium]
MIRQARVEDAERMGEMLVATWLAAHEGQMPHHLWEKRRRKWTPAVSARGWRGTLQEMAEGGDGRSCIYLAVTETGDIIGLCAAFAEAVQPQASVVALYVRQEQQRVGNGRLLLQTTFDHLQRGRIETVHIGVLAANTPARRFYERMGGVLIGERSFDEEGTPLPEAVYGWRLK